MEIKVMHQVMEWNEDVSDAVKADLAAHHVCLINVLGSPGAGKTSTIVSLIDRLRDRYRIGVIEGDIAGQIDADKIHALGLPVVQLDTDGACHIEAMSIQHILPEFDLDALDVLFVENIGNLVCPAEFNIGESFRLALLSIPEGDDKVEKYPLMFATSDLDSTISGWSETPKPPIRISPSFAFPAGTGWDWMGLQRGSQTALTHP